MAGTSRGRVASSWMEGRRVGSGVLVGETVDVVPEILVGETVVVPPGLLIGETVGVLPRFLTGVTGVVRVQYDLSSFAGTGGGTASSFGGVRTGEKSAYLAVAESDGGPLDNKDDGVCARCGYAGRAVNSHGPNRGIVLPVDLVR